MPAGPLEQEKLELDRAAKKAEQQLRSERLSQAQQEGKRSAELEEKLRRAERLCMELQAAKDQHAEERAGMREQLAIAQAEKRSADDLRARAERQVDSLQREKEELIEREQASKREQREERESLQEERAVVRQQLEQLQRLEALARRSQADVDTLQARLDATAQRADRLAAEREEAVRRGTQAHEDMTNLQTQSHRLGEMTRHTVHLAHQEKGAMAERVELAEGRCSKLLGLVEEKGAAAAVAAQQLAVARTELRALEERNAALQTRAERSEAWGQLLMRERDEARDEMTRLGHLGVVQERVSEFTSAAMRDRFKDLSLKFAGQWPDEWCDTLMGLGAPPSVVARPR